MMENDPKQALIEHWYRPLDGFEAQEGTIQFLRSRLLPHAQLHEVAFESKRGDHQRLLCLVLSQPDGTWHVNTANNISGARRRICQGEEPHVLLAGGNLNGHLHLHGHVVDGDQEATRIRLVFHNGRTLEDTVQDGLVLFVPEQGFPLPTQVELYDSAGNLVGTHPWPYIHPSARSHFPEPSSLTNRLTSASFSDACLEDQAPGQAKTSLDPGEPPEC